MAPSRRVLITRKIGDIKSTLNTFHKRRTNYGERRRTDLEVVMTLLIHERKQL